MKEIIIKIELANAILQYLGSKPFAEVYKLINALQVSVPKKEEVEKVQTETEEK